MYVNLYSRKQLNKTKQFLLVAGTFLAVGGAVALARELFYQTPFRLNWAVAGSMLLVVGLLWSLAARNTMLFKDAYFSLNPERVSYRLALLGREVVILWKDISALKIQEQLITFELSSGRSIKMRLGAIQQPDVARHVSRSIHLAALEKHIMVNGVQPSQAKPAAQG